MIAGRKINISASKVCSNLRFVVHFNDLLQTYASSRHFRGYFDSKNQFQRSQRDTKYALLFNIKILNTFSVKPFQNTRLLESAIHKFPLTVPQPVTPTFLHRRHHDIPWDPRRGRRQAQHAQLRAAVRHSGRQRQGQVHSGELPQGGARAEETPGLRHRRHFLQPHHHGCCE